METLEITADRVLSIWWPMTWRGFALALIVVAPGVMIELNAPDLYRAWSIPLNLFTTGIWIATWVFALWVALRKTYSEFTVVLVPRIPKLKSAGDSDSLHTGGFTVQSLSRPPFQPKKSDDLA